MVATYVTTAMRAQVLRAALCALALWLFSPPHLLLGSTRLRPLGQSSGWPAQGSMAPQTPFHQNVRPELRHTASGGA